MPTPKPTIVPPAAPAVPLPTHDPVVAAAIEAANIGIVTHGQIGLGETSRRTSLDLRQDALERFVCTTQATTLEGITAQLEIAKAKAYLFVGIKSGEDNRLVDETTQLLLAALDAAISTIEGMTKVSRDDMVGEHYSFADMRDLAVRKTALEKWLPVVLAEGKIDLRRKDEA